MEPQEYLRQHPNDCWDILKSLDRFFPKNTALWHFWNQCVVFLCLLVMSQWLVIYKRNVRVMTIIQSGHDTIQNTVQCRYNVVNILQNIYERHHIARLPGQGLSQPKIFTHRQWPLRKPNKTYRPPSPEKILLYILYIYAKIVYEMIYHKQGFFVSMDFFFFWKKKSFLN